MCRSCMNKRTGEEAAWLVVNGVVAGFVRVELLLFFFFFCSFSLSWFLSHSTFSVYIQSSVIYYYYYYYSSSFCSLTSHFCSIRTLIPDNFDAHFIEKTVISLFYQRLPMFCMAPLPTYLLPRRPNTTVSYTLSFVFLKF